jgi:Cu+-exporting ATPase
MTTTATINTAKDPVCGMDIDPATAAGRSEYGGTTYHFCSDSCKQRFDADPAHYVAGEAGTALLPAPPLGLSTQAATDGSHHNGTTADSEAERCDLPITGMSCAACARRIEKQLSKTLGVRQANVNFATSKATVEYDPETIGIRQLIDTVEDAGYGTAGTARADFVVDDSRGPQDRASRWSTTCSACPAWSAPSSTWHHGRARRVPARHD